MTQTSVADRAGKAGAQQNEIYQRVTDIIIERLSHGKIPWKKPWGSSEFLPKNYATNRPYNGFNALLLSFAYEQPFYLTFHQVKELGGTVKKGSKSLPVIYYDRLYRMKETGAKISHDLAKALSPADYNTIAYLKYYNVFNVSQIEGIDFVLPEMPSNQHEVLDNCEQIIARMPNRPKLEHGGGQACYIPMMDKVQMPHKANFHKAEGYYQTFFHELVHSTGHASRLNRKEVVEPNKFGTVNYSKEELVAELGACFLMSKADSLSEFEVENSTAYIQSWIKVLKDDPKFILEASGKASRAAEYILNEGG